MTVKGNVGGDIHGSAARHAGKMFVHCEVFDYHTQALPRGLCSRSSSIRPLILCSVCKQGLRQATGQATAQGRWSAAGRGVMGGSRTGGR